jgi:acetate kinase
MPAHAYLYGLPYEYYEKHKVRRYGFHGTSHDYVSVRTAEMLGKTREELKTIVCHLGNGASISAVMNGKSVDTSMGLTPLEGLVMGTRSGSLDPAIIEYICKKENLSLEEAINVLNKKSGVQGLSGISSDFRDILSEMEKDNEKAKLTMAVYCYNVAKYIGAYTAAMNGVDAIVFTAGVGENNPLIRKMVCEYFGYLGVAIDDAVNDSSRDDAIVSTKDSKVAVLVVATNEELKIARETLALV